jgi:MFS family permease
MLHIFHPALNTFLFLLQASVTQPFLSSEYNISSTVSILTVSLFVEGLGIGPLLLGPLSEFFGRWYIYVVSYTILWAWSWGVAFAPNAATHMVCRFLGGLSGSAFLSVAGGSVGDLFSDADIA